VPEADRLLDNEPTVDSIVVVTNDTRVDIHGQTTGLDELLGQDIISLCDTANSRANIANLLANSVNSLRKEREKLEQEAVAMQNRSAKMTEDGNAALQPILLAINCRPTREQINIARANLPKIEEYFKKRDIEQIEDQEQQAKRLKFNADYQEIQKEVMATR
jgi:hypothetical protein